MVVVNGVMRSTWHDEIKPAWRDENKSTKSNKPAWHDEKIGAAWCGGQWRGIVRSVMRELDTEREICVADEERDI